MLYTAKLSRNFRDVHTLSPKVLLRSVIDDSSAEFRDHCWVNKCAKLSRVIPRANKTSILIQFEADIKEYGIYETKATLTNIRNIKVLGRA